jgi:hypothetical protein
MKHRTYRYCPIFGRTGRLTEDGQSMGEYLIIVALVAIVVVFAIRQYGGSVSNSVGDAAEMVASARQDHGETRVFRESRGVPQEQKGRESFSDDSYALGGKTNGVVDSAESSDSLRADGVGAREYTPVDVVRVDWPTIGIIGVVIIGVGIAVVLFLKSSIKKSGKKGKKQGLRQVSN